VADAVAEVVHEAAVGVGAVPLEVAAGEQQARLAAQAPEVVPTDRDVLEVADVAGEVLLLVIPVLRIPFRLEQARMEPESAVALIVAVALRPRGRSGGQEGQQHQNRACLSGSHLFLLFWKILPIPSESNGDAKLRRKGASAGKPL
jgi:hypothetical protein